jgi:molybdopterin converting factor small subunit
MVTVKFFGLIRIHSNVKYLEVNTGTVREAIDQIVKCQPQIDKESLLQSIIIHNKVQLNGNKRLKCNLCDGDELVFLSPASGG